MQRAMTNAVLARQTESRCGSGGVSAGNRAFGFRPAFRDAETDMVYASEFADGHPAPVHVLDGLPDEVVLARDAGGRVTAVKGSVIAGFLCDGKFYTRDEAAHHVSCVEMQAA
jgi:hypothetical protein